MFFRQSRLKHYFRWRKFCLAKNMFPNKILYLIHIIYISGDITPGTSTSDVNVGTGMFTKENIKAATIQVSIRFTKFIHGRFPEKKKFILI